MIYDLRITNYDLKSNRLLKNSFYVIPEACP